MTPTEIESFVDIGRKLVSDLEYHCASYHVKSDQHEILVWESAIVIATVAHVQDQIDIPENLRGSTLLSDRGKCLRGELPKLTCRVEGFFEAYNKLMSDWHE